MIKWMYFAIHIEFADTPGNELRILRTKIEDQNCFMHAAKIKRK